MVWLLCAAVVTVTLLPLWQTETWWVRMWDFPRVQILISAGVVMVLSAFLLDISTVVIALLMIGVGVYQFARIYPYTPLAPVELTLAPDDDGSVTLLSSNVLMENEQHQRLIDVIDRVDPDVLLLMETDQVWADAMAPVLERYETVLSEPRDDHYGIIFASRLPTGEAEILHLTQDDTPSVFAEMTGPGGVVFRFVGLHPQPPVPGQDTEERDAQIRYAARFAAKSGVPLVTMGDFNDVAWSDTSQKFKHLGGYLDARVGRGLFASFDAHRFYLRCPIDHFYVTENVAVVAFGREAYVGSDHFPMVAKIRLDADLAARLNHEAKPLTDEERQAIDETLVRQRALLGHRDFSRPAPETGGD